jgi:hypothetical protein
MNHTDRHTLIFISFPSTACNKALTFIVHSGYNSDGSQIRISTTSSTKQHMNLVSVYYKAGGSQTLRHCNPLKL